MSESDKIEVVVVRETDKALLLRDESEAGREAWFPKSEVFFHRRNTKTGKATADVPLWLLKAKGWAA